MLIFIFRVGSMLIKKIMHVPQQNGSPVTMVTGHVTQPLTWETSDTSPAIQYDVSKFTHFNINVRTWLQLQINFMYRGDARGVTFKKKNNKQTKKQKHCLKQLFCHAIRNVYYQEPEKTCEFS